VSVTNGTDTGISQGPIRVLPGQPYVLSAYVLTNVASKVYVGVRWYSDWPGVNSIRDDYTSTAPANVWTRLSAAVTAPANAQRADLFIRGITAAGENFRVDGVQLEQASIISAYAPRPDEILDGTIGTTKISDNAITTPKLIAGSVVAGKIAANAVGANEIQANAIVADKIAANAVTASKIAARTITAERLALGALDNLAPNGNLATGDFSDWRPWYNGNEVLARGAAGVPSGAPANFVCRMFSTAGAQDSSIFNCPRAFSDADAWRYGIQCRAGERFVVSIDAASTAAASNSIAIYLYYSKTDGSYNFSVLAGSFSAGASWTNYTPPSFAMPADAVAFWPYVYVQCTFAGGGSVYFTNLRVIRAASAELIVDGAVIADKIAANAVTAAKISAGAVVAGKIAADAVTANEIAANAITAAKIQAGAITATKLAVAMGGSNFVKNSSFESNTGTAPDGFGMYDNSGEATYFGVQTSGGRTGANFLRISFNANNSTKGFYFANNGQYDNSGIFRTGRWYVFSWYARASGGALGYIMQTAWNIGPNDYIVLENPALNGNWQRYAFACRWTGGSVDNNGFASVAGGIGATSSIDFDDIQVEEGEYPTGYAPRLAPGEVIGTFIADGAIVTNKLAADAITANKIAAGAVTAAKLSVSSLDAISVNVGTLTAGVIRNTADSFRVDVTNGRTIATTGSYMKVSGAPFGSSSQFIEWYGPYQSNLANCTESNATYYLKTNGTAYFGGALSAGVLKNAAQSTSVSSTAEIIVGAFSTNGNTKSIVLSYNYRYTYRCNAGTGALTGAAGAATILLERSINGGAWATIGTLNANESENTVLVDGDPAVPDEVRFGIGGSLTVTDNSASTTDMRLRGRITARTLRTFGGTGKINIVETQNVSVVSTE
jgi:hypothetical protein